MKKLYIFLVLFSLGLFSVQAQETELITDRPDQTESAFVVPKGAFQIESGFVYEKFSSSLKNYAYNTSLFRYGLLDNLEVRLGMEYAGYKVKFGGVKTTESGLAPFVVGFKTVLAQEKAGIPQLALLSSFVIPNTGAKEFENDNLGADIRANLQYTINEKMSFGANLGVAWSGAEGEDYATAIYTAVIGVGLTEQLGGFAEIYGFLPGEGKNDHRWDAGFTYLVRDNLQLDLSGGIGLSDISPDYFLSMGFSLLIP